MNNFQQLLELESGRMRREDSDRILQNVWSSLGFLRMVGDVADIYVSKVVDVMAMASSTPHVVSQAEPVSYTRPANAPDLPQKDLRNMKPGAPDADGPVR